MQDFRKTRILWMTGFTLVGKKFRTIYYLLLYITYMFKFQQLVINCQLAAQLWWSLCNLGMTLHHCSLPESSYFRVLVTLTEHLRASLLTPREGKAAPSPSRHPRASLQLSCVKTTASEVQGILAFCQSQITNGFCMCPRPRCFK